MSLTSNINEGVLAHSQSTRRRPIVANPPSSDTSSCANVQILLMPTSHESALVGDSLEHIENTSFGISVASHPFPVFGLDNLLTATSWKLQIQAEEDY